MLRDKNLIPLSRQHQHALALCVRIDRSLQAGELDLNAWQAEIQQHFQLEISVHFTAEERELFPAASRYSELRPLVEVLLAEHVVLREFFARAAARTLTRDSLRGFGEKLSAHIRKEERQLFEDIQQRMKPEDMAALGAALEQALQDAAQGCTLPTEATRLRPKTGG